MNLGKVIRVLRKQAKMSQNDLAKVCGLSQPYLSLVEKNERDIHTTSLKTICEALNVPLPIVYFMAIEKEDIPEDRRQAYELLSPHLTSMMQEIFPTSKGLMEFKNPPI